jgi:PAS domain S-box-containing protein
MKISQKGILLVAVPLMFQLVFIISLSFLKHQAEDAAEREARAKNFILEINISQSRTMELASSLAAYALLKIDGYGEKFDRLTQLYEKQTETLDREAALIPSVSNIYPQLKQERRDALTILSGIRDAIYESRQSGRLNADSIHFSQQLKRISHRMSRASDQLTDAIENEAKSYPQLKARSRQLLDTFIWISIALNVLMAVLLASFFHQGISNRIKQLIDNTDRLARQKTLLPPMKGTDEISHLDNVFHDMAEALTAAHRKEQSILQNVSEVICSIDQALNFMRVSQASEVVWQCSEEDLLGKSVTSVIATETINDTVRQFESARTAAAGVSFENKTLLKDGSTAWMAWSVHWSEQEQAYFCVIHDVSRLKHIEQLKRDFVNMISHDLRTPLTSVSMFLDMLGRGVYGPLNERGAGNTVKLRTSVIRLIKLINNLLDLEKMERGGIELLFSDIDVATLAQNAADACEAVAAAKDVSIFVEDAELSVEGDEQRLFQVMQNFISNAIKFSPAGGELRVQARAVAEMVEIRIVDQGCGIAADEIGMLFERFRQVGTKSHGGTGLGLAICKSIVEEHHGTVGVESILGEGSTFWFRIPMKQPRLESPSESRVATEGSEQKKLNIELETENVGAPVSRAV